MKKYVSTSSLCESYDLGKEFFTRRIDSGVFIQNIHFIKKDTTTRWDIEAIEIWWRGTPIYTQETEDILSRVLAS